MTFSVPALLVRGVVRASPMLRSEDVGRRIRRDAAVHAYVGPNGSGKSLLAAFDTIPTLAGIPWFCTNVDHLHTQQGRTSGVRMVLSTMPFLDGAGDAHPLWIPLNDPRQLLDAEHCDIVLDEVSGVADSQDGMRLPSAVKTKLQKLRHFDCLARITAPDWDRVAKELRRCIQAVTTCLGFVPVAKPIMVDFDGPHRVTPQPSDPPALAEMLDALACIVEGPHQHDAHRQWKQRRIVYGRTFDSNTFTEWTTEKKERVRPLVRNLIHVPTFVGSMVYDTYAGVESFGHVTETGTCLDCGGRRTQQRCECHGSARGRLRATA